MLSQIRFSKSPEVSVRHRSPILSIHPEQLGAIEPSVASVQILEIKTPDNLVDRQDFLVCTR